MIIGVEDRVMAAVCLRLLRLGDLDAATRLYETYGRTPATVGTPHWDAVAAAILAAGCRNGLSGSHRPPSEGR